MWKDQIVAEVRRARLEIEKKCEENFARIYTRAVEVQKKAAAKFVFHLVNRKQEDRAAI